MECWCAKVFYPVNLHAGSRKVMTRPNIMSFLLMDTCQNVSEA